MKWTDYFGTVCLAGAAPPWSFFLALAVREGSGISESIYVRTVWAACN